MHVYACKRVVAEGGQVRVQRISRVRIGSVQAVVECMDETVNMNVDMVSRLCDIVLPDVSVVAPQVSSKLLQRHSRMSI
jgi:hypothetical protein